MDLILVVSILIREKQREVLLQKKSSIYAAGFEVGEVIVSQEINTRNTASEPRKGKGTDSPLDPLQGTWPC